MTVIRKILAWIILISEPSVDFLDKIQYGIRVIVKIAPIAYIMSLTKWWFEENEQFGTFMCMTLLLNMFVGVVFHLKSGTFKFSEFIWKNIGMASIVICGYMVLEMLRYTAGDNLAGELFKVLIQITTLLYPGSKVLKNLFIMSNGKFPPEFIMKKLYDFEKNGDLDNFFKTDKDKKE